MTSTRTIILALKFSRTAWHARRCQGSTGSLCALRYSLRRSLGSARRKSPCLGRRSRRHCCTRHAHCRRCWRRSRTPEGRSAARQPALPPQQRTLLRRHAGLIGGPCRRRGVPGCHLQRQEPNRGDQHNRFGQPLDPRKPKELQQRQRPRRAADTAQTWTVISRCFMTCSRRAPRQ